ncbi:MAG: TolC family protein [Gammaproteobacteria bacterium]|nr:TolC family protein [Gammaproteobacteria bacterium]
MIRAMSRELTRVAGWLTRIVFVVSLFGNVTAFANEDRLTVPLQPGEVLAASEVHFPEILNAMAKRRGADGAVLAADGAFDLVFDADGFNRVDGFFDGSVVQGRATQPLGPLGTNIYAGYELSDGDFPIYENEYYTNNSGSLKAGLVFSLLRDRAFDERRFGRKDARLAREQADFDVLLTKIGVQQQALVAYWRWLTAGRQLYVYEELLRIALDRESGLQEQVDSGARAEIFLVENRQNITRRQTLVAGAERDFQIAANGLSFYYRDENGEPIIPVREQLPEVGPVGVFETLAVTVDSAASTALARRPELQLLKTAVERAQARIALADNNLKPRVDFGVEVSSGLGSVAEGGESFDSNDTVVGFQFEVPLQRRAAKGQLRQQRAEVESLRQQQRLTEDRIELEVENILLELNVAEKLLLLAEQEVQQSETLKVAEQNRFASGASDFFLVNIREEVAANALIQYYTADLKRRSARADYDAATVDVERLGINNGAGH